MTVIDHLATTKRATASGDQRQQQQQAMAQMNGQDGSAASSSSSAISANNLEAALFACTRCNSRHPFEDLSADMMLCKGCRDTFVVVKCTYCRTEFQQDSKKSLSSVCRKCDLNVKTYGKPSSCEYCNIIAAFIGSKCQRCTYSEKKYGLPVPCDQCKQRCAFDRKDAESRKKVDGKLLCWLCTLSYKRALAKAGKNKDHHQSSHRKRDSSGHRFSRSNGSNGPDNDAAVSKKPRMDYVKSIMGNSNGGTFMPSPTSSAVTSTTSSGSSSSMANSGPVTSTTTSMESASDVMSASDNMVVVTQLRERILSLDRQIKNKNQELLKKDVRITELKSEISKEQRDCREKVQEMQKKHSERINELQQKISALTKQMATKSKEKSNQSKKAGSNGNDNSPLNF